MRKIGGIVIGEKKLRIDGRKLIGNSGKTDESIHYSSRKEALT